MSVLLTPTLRCSHPLPTTSLLTTGKERCNAGRADENVSDASAAQTAKVAHAKRLLTFLKRSTGYSLLAKMSHEMKNRKYIVCRCPVCE